MFSAGADYSLLSEFKIPDDADVKYPPKNSYRYLSSLTQLYANSNFGLRSLQDFKKISIVAAKGYCYGWPYYPAADADLVISAADALFGNSHFRHVVWPPRMVQWALMMVQLTFRHIIFNGQTFNPTA